MVGTRLPPLLLLAQLYTSTAFQLPNAQLKHPTPRTIHFTSNNDQDPKSGNVKFFELDNAFDDDGENVVGSKFFGGSAVKEELYIPDEEERALELQNAQVATEYKRFEDENVFDELGRRVGMAYQVALNEILYGDKGEEGVATTWREDVKLVWETPIDAKNAKSPLMELKASKEFYNKLDVAILTAKTMKSTNDLHEVQIRWDVGAVWPNPWESRILLTGTSMLTVREDGDNLFLVKQVDQLDGSNPGDVVGSLSSQLKPRFWDFYHIGMTPSAELDPRFTHLSSDKLAFDSSKNVSGKKGLFSGYKVSYIPSRLVTEPSLIDTNGRDARMAQCLPDHGFTTAIKTMGPNKESFVPVSPIEVCISNAEGEDGSLIKWSVPVPPEFASRLVLPLPTIEDEEDEEVEEENNDDLATSSQSPLSRMGRPRTKRPDPPTSLQCNYTLRPSRLVATLPYAGNPQDEEVTQLRRQLYQEVVEKDGFKPKLDPVTNRPMFFFWMNDAKACFTRQGGLGMAVYEWRADWSKSNEVGIELEI
jgi:hypothetical protein